MNRTIRTLLVLAIALIVATIASVSIYKVVQRIPERQVEVATVHAVVAAKPMAMGTLLTADDVKVVGWPAKTPLSGGFSDAKAVVDRGLVAAVVENEPITESKLAPVGVGGGLPPSIPTGMRAISVKVNEVIGVAGFVVPGTRVDVVVTIQRQTQQGGQDSMSRIVVAGVQVLTAGTKIEQTKKDGEPIPSSVVTLLVTPEDAEKIALASNEGHITLTLRNPVDTKPAETQGVKLASLMGAPEPPPVVKVVKNQKVAVAPKPAVEEKPVRSVYTVETIRAAKRTEEVVR
jgi:pilus assembly protein CpaB